MMSSDPPERAPPTARLGPPARLTQEQVGCLKTALALVIVKGRWEKQRKKKRKQSEPGARPSSLLPTVDPPAMTAVTGPSVSAGCNAAAMDGNEQVSAMRSGSRGLKDWVAHLDHMMSAALRFRMDPSASAKYQSVVTHVTRQLNAIIARACAELDDDSEQQQEAGVLAVKDWVFTSLLDADEPAVDLWIDIGFESHTVMDDFPQIPMYTIPDLLLFCLGLILQSGLSLATPICEVRAHHLRLFTALHPLASAEAINDCWTQLGDHDTPATCSTSAHGQYLEQCRRSDATVNREWAEPAGKHDCVSGTVDSSQVLGLRRYLSDFFINVVQSGAKTYASHGD